MAEKSFWMVWNPNTKKTSFQHPSRETAQKEAERLAYMHREEKFYVLEAVGVAQTPKTTYQPLDDGIPF